MKPAEPKESATIPRPRLALQEFVAGLAALPAPRLAPLLWDDQRQRWQSGERATVEMYVQHLPPARAADLLVDLIYGEFILRQEAGEQPTCQEYQSRFPHCHAPIGRQLSLHQALSAQEPAPAAGSPVAPVGLSATVLPDEQAALASASETGEMPAEIAGYKIIALLGKGGQGVVYRAVHPALGRDVVIKLGREDVSAARETEALIQEGRILAELDDPGLARIYDLRIHEGHVCLIMEYIRGRHLEQEARDHPWPPQTAASLVAQVARALAAAHQRGVIHRDIKPLNILMAEDGRPRLIDFGLARFVDPWRSPANQGELSGTVTYMAPEQARGETPGPLCDVFALGGVLFFLLTGRAPFHGANFHEVHEKVKRNEWDRTLLADPRIPSKLRALVERALASEPSARPASAEALARTLEQFSRPARGRWIWAAGGILAAALVGCGLWLALGPTPTPPAPAKVDDPPAFRPGAAEVKQRPFSLQVRVWRGQRYVEMPDSLPLMSQEEVRFEAVAPTGMHAALYLRSSSGKLQPLAARALLSEDQPLNYPENVRQATRLAGPAGNELILLGARAAGPVALAELSSLLAGCSAWPVLPEDALLGLSPRGVKTIQKRRDLGPLTDRPDPEGEVQKGLEELQGRLSRQFDYFEAVVFSHGE